MQPTWRSRLRWRMRGAWMWPVFCALTIADGLLLRARPIAGGGTALIPALLLAFFFNLVAVAVLAPMAGALWRRRRRPDLPRAVAHDYAGTALLVAVAVALLGGGLLHGPAIDREQRDFRAQSDAVRRYVNAQAPPAFRRNVARATSLRLERDLYRTCVPGPDPERSLCLFVNTDQDPAGVRLDPSREPNASFAARGSS